MVPARPKKHQLLLLRHYRAVGEEVEMDSTHGFSFKLGQHLVKK